MSSIIPSWNRAIKPQAVVYEPKATPTSAMNLVVGDVIELPTVQRLVVTEIKSASEGAVVVGQPMLVLQSQGYGGVFNDAQAAPIVMPSDAKINRVSTPAPKPSDEVPSV